MKLVCSTCGSTIQPQDVNIATDMAKCSNCNSLHRASELIEKVDITDLLVMPPNAKVIMEQGRNKSIVLTAPANGFNVEAIGISIFAIFWFGFITIWTIFAIYGMPLMALFSIPFWLAGFFMARMAFNKIFETQKVVFTDYEVTLEQKRPFGGKQTTISKKDITDVVMTDAISAGPMGSFAQANSRTRRSQRVDFPTIKTKNKPHFFFQNLPVADQKWTVRLLKHVIVGN